ncbi:MAG: hypothetical protein WKF89_10070 [Chitinophagaceae bacterium]
METPRMEERLWEFIDGSSQKEDRIEIDRLIQTAPEWQLKYEELLQVHQMIHATELETPSMRFTRNIMEEISKHQVSPATRNYLNKKIIYGIGVFLLAMIIGLFIVSLAQVDWSGGTSSSPMPDRLDIEWSRLWNNGYTKIFMMINTILGLVLLDKYLEKKKTQSKHQI